MILVYAPGVFDLFHIGHSRFLRTAKMLGDRLYVGVPTDEVVEEDKGRLPIIPFQDRLLLLHDIYYVDRVIGYDTLDFLPALQSLKPNILAVGEEWGDRPHHKAAEAWCREHDCRVVKIPRYPWESSTAIKQRIRERS